MLWSSALALIRSPMLQGMNTPFHSMQQHRDRGLIKGLQVCCLEVVTETEHSLSQTQELNTYRNKIAHEALLSCSCNMLPSNQTGTHSTFFFPMFTLHIFLQQTPPASSFVFISPIHPISFPFPLQ